MNVPAHEDHIAYEPHLPIFLSFLTFEKRPNKDVLSIEWIIAHYKGMCCNTAI